MTFYIPEFRVPQLFGRLEKLNRRAKKLSLPLITYSETGKEEFRKVYKITISEGQEHNTGESVVCFKEVDVVGEEPKLPGSWEFLAAIEHIEEGNIVSASPENTFDLSKYRSCKPVCDHCGHIRSRKKTYILINRTGEKQVGSTCIKDFLGGNGDPEEMLELASELWALVSEFQDEDSWEEGCRGSSKYLELTRFLGCVIQLVKKFGFTSRKQAQERLKSSTADDACSLYYSKEPRNQVEHENILLAASYLERGRAILEALPDRNDFEHNLYVVSKREFLDPKHCGIAAYFIGWLNKKDRDEQEKTATCNEWFGSAGERQELNLKFVGEHAFNSDIYGVSYLYRFQDDAGRTLIWKTGKAEIFEKDKITKLKGTIKKHTEYKGRKQTELSRCKLLTENLI